MLGRPARRACEPRSAGELERLEPDVELEVRDVLAKLVADLIPELSRSSSGTGVRRPPGRLRGRTSDGGTGVRPLPSARPSEHAAPRALAGGECIPEPQSARKAGGSGESAQIAGKADRRPSGPPAILYPGLRDARPILHDSFAHEAHLPAQEAQARPHATASARACVRAPGRRDAQAPPRQGPHAAHPVDDSPARWRDRARQAPPPVAQRRVRPRLPRGPLAREPAPRRLRLPARRRAEEEPRLGVSVGRKVGGAVERNRVKRLLQGGLLGLAPSELPDGHDFVIVARPAAGELARERRRGRRSRTRCASVLAIGRLSPGSDGGVSALRTIAVAPIRVYQRAISPRDPRALQVPSDLLGVRRAGDPPLRCAPGRRPRRLAAAALQPVEPRRRGLRRGPDAVPRRAARPA